MPIYNFKDNVTGEVTEEFMSISARDEYLAANPNLSVVILKAPQTVSGVGELNSKVDNGFKELMGGIADANPYSPMASEWGTKKDANSVAVRKVVDKVKSKTGSATKVE